MNSNKTVSGILEAINWQAVITGLPTIINDTNVIINTNNISGRIQELGLYLDKIDKVNLSNITKQNISQKLTEIINNIQDNDIKEDLLKVVNNIASSYCNLCLSTNEDDIKIFAEQIANYSAGFQHIETRLNYKIFNNVTDILKTSLIIALQISITAAVVMLL